MIKKISVFMFLLCMLVSLMGPNLAQADDGLSVVDTSVEARFPLTMKFSLAVESDVDITDIRLHYTVERKSFARVVSEIIIEFTSDTAVETDWTWDMRRTGGLPPGAVVEYWWTVEDENGKTIETSPEQVVFNDNRFDWQKTTTNAITLYWYRGNQSFIDEITESIQQALALLSDSSGAYLSDPASIYIYGSTQDLQGSMIFPQEWTGGVAFTRYSTIAIGIAPYNVDWGTKAIAHELTHLVIHQMTLNPYSDLPTWLDEGLAMQSEGPLRAQFSNSLEAAIASDTLISVQSLSSPFSAYSNLSYLSYAQSYSLVEFLINEYGRGKMLELLTTFREGSGYDDAFIDVYGFDMDELDTLWRDYVNAPSQTVYGNEENSVSVKMDDMVLSKSY